MDGDEPMIVDMESKVQESLQVWSINHFYSVFFFVRKQWLLLRRIVLATPSFGHGPLKGRVDATPLQCPLPRFMRCNRNFKYARTLSVVSRLARRSQNTLMQVKNINWCKPCSCVGKYWSLIAKSEQINNWVSDKTWVFAAPSEHGEDGTQATHLRPGATPSPTCQPASIGVRRYSMVQPFR